MYAAGYFKNKVNVLLIHPNEAFVKILNEQLLPKYSENPKYMNPNSQGCLFFFFSTGYNLMQMGAGPNLMKFRQYAQKKNSKIFSGRGRVHKIT